MSVGDRTIWCTVKIRALDIEVGDVIRNAFGKWDVVKSVNVHSDGWYVTAGCEVGGGVTHRVVQLVDIQVAKPS